MNSIKILGIESSFDDTAVSIYDSCMGLLYHDLVSLSGKLKKDYGGVVPNLAFLHHLKSIIPLIKKVLKRSKIELPHLDAIAYTAGPGLLGSLQIGATIATSLAFSCGIPAIPIHHMEGHLFSPMINKNIEIKFPLVGLLVSGKHTQLITASSMGSYNLLGKTLDDAVGEVFDKVARFLGFDCMGESGGKVISRLSMIGKKKAFFFPRPMKNNKNLNFSFSGLKTSIFNILKKSKFSFQKKCDVARSFEEAVVDILVYKTKKALYQTKINNVIVAGGVSANKLLRKKMLDLVVKKYIGNIFFPDSEFCTDNAAMIAYVGFLRFKYHKSKYSSRKIIVKPNWSMFNNSLNKF